MSMLKNGKPFGKDYFEELLERIREIRASERRAYQKITDVFEQCSYDYDKNSETQRIFMPLFRINCILRLQERQRQNLYMNVLILRNRRWG